MLHRGLINEGDLDLLLRSLDVMPYWRDRLKGIAYLIPGLLAVRKGTRVEFPNRDDFYHNVFSYSKAKRFDLGRYPTGESPSINGVTFAMTQ